MNALHKHSRTLAALAAALLLSASAQAALLDRGNGLIYDTDLNITWMQDWNYMVSSGYDGDGRQGWVGSDRWARDLEYGGFSDWRLPSARNPDGSLCAGNGCIGSEIGHLWHVELGNPVGGIANHVGPFVNMQIYQNNALYNTGTVVPGNRVYVFDVRHGYQSQSTLTSGPLTYSVAVRDGDVLAVPEPQSWAMLLAGLAVCFAVKRRRGAGKS